MSIILDALKKLDREKSSRRNRTAHIATEILKPELARPEKRTLRYLAAAGLTAVVTAAVTYAVVQVGLFSKSSTPAPVTLPAPGQQVALAPVAREPAGDARSEITRIPSKIQDAGESTNPTPLSSPDQGPADIRAARPPGASAPVFREPVGGAQSEKTRGSSKIQGRGEDKSPGPPNPPVDRRPIDVKPADRQGAPAPVFREPGGDVRGETNPVPPKIQSQGEDKSPAPSSSPSGQGSADAKSSSKQAPSSPVSRELVREPTPSGSAATPPAMKLSGIVWSSEPSERLAVINSQVVKEGAIIEGVKVVEIGPTKVRLMHNGTPFEISINLFGK